MAANKIRVKVKGSVGKSIRIGGATAAAAILGVNVMLPDGSIPSLAQLAAALSSPPATNNNPGNIINPGQMPTVIFSQVQYVPPNVLYQARAVQTEEDAGEDTYHMAVPGPSGTNGRNGRDGRDADDAEDPLMIPGPSGRNGINAGPPIVIWPDDVEDPMQIPGAQGQQGIQGVPGIPGTGGSSPVVVLQPEEGEDYVSWQIPGPKGATGANGTNGVNGVTIALQKDDEEDATMIPQGFSMQIAGPSAQVGLTAIPGSAPTAMRSDAAPALNPGISPTWTGLHTFAANVSRTTVEIFGAPTLQTVFIQSAPSSVGTSFGVLIYGGTTSSDTGLWVADQTGAHTHFQVDGAGNLVAPTSGMSFTLASVSGSATQTNGNLLLQGIGGTGGFIRTQDNTPLSFGANSSVYGSISGTGNWTLAAPTSGVTLAINGTASAATITAEIIGGFSGAGAVSTLLVQDNGNTNGGSIKIVGNGATTPSKVIRVVGGQLQIINDAYSAQLFTMSDSGATTINCAAGVALTLNGELEVFQGTSNSYAGFFQGAASGQSFGILIFAGLSSTDAALRVTNQSGSADYFQVRGDGEIIFNSLPTQTGSPSAGGAGALPATPAGYAAFIINGVIRKFPYY